MKVLTGVGVAPFRLRHVSRSWGLSRPYLRELASRAPPGKHRSVKHSPQGIVPSLCESLRCTLCVFLTRTNGGTSFLSAPTTPWWYSKHLEGYINNGTRTMRGLPLSLEGNIRALMRISQNSWNNNRMILLTCPRGSKASQSPVPTGSRPI